jgi:glutathione S-transferase
MITVHGRNTSSNVQPVLWLLTELGLPYQRLDVGGAFGGTDTPQYRAMNPMGLIPALEDGDVTMFESQAILRYLAARNGEAFWPADPIARAPIDQWMEWSKTTVAPTVVYKIFWQLIRTPVAVRDHAALEEAVASARTIMAVAETQLTQYDWIAGAQMSLADISFGTQLYRYFTLPFERDDLPKLAAYYERLTQRPAYAEQVMVSYEPLRAPGA